MAGTSGAGLRGRDRPAIPSLQPLRGRANGAGPGSTRTHLPVLPRRRVPDAATMTERIRARPPTKAGGSPEKRKDREDPVHLAPGAPCTRKLSACPSWLRVDASYLDRRPQRADLSAGRTAVYHATQDLGISRRYGTRPIISSTSRFPLREMQFPASPRTSFSRYGLVNSSAFRIAWISLMRIK